MSTNIMSAEFLTGLPLAIATTTVHGRAMSISWLATTGGILVVWMIIILIEGPGLAFWLMTGLWVLHTASFGIASMITNRKN